MSIDRRSESGSGRGSRERLMQRTRGAAKEAIRKSIQDGKIGDIGKDGIDVTVPKGGISEPHIHHGKGGINHRVLPGNDVESARHSVGDRLPRPSGGGGRGGNKASNSGSSEDAFLYHLSPKEFWDLYFEDLELPNMFKQEADDLEQMTVEQAGFSQAGSFNRLSLVRSKIEKIKRETVMNRLTNERIVELLDEKKEIFLQYGSIPGIKKDVEPSTEIMSIKTRIRLLETEVDTLKAFYLSRLSPDQQTRIAAIDGELETLNAKRSIVARWREHSDLRYRAVEELPTPTSKAVVFCKMDVSGSMTEEMKSNAKDFFLLLHTFVKRQYERVEVVFIRHTQEAEEVDQKTFFEDPKSGGTVVSSALEKFLEIQKERYSEKEWNIFVAQASDGDNCSNDSEKTTKLMKEILPKVQGYFHIEVGKRTVGSYDYFGRPIGETDLWKTYKPLADQFKDRFWMQKVRERKDIWPVFREFMKKRGNTDSNMQPRAAAFNIG